jgi:hypothetical protein
MLSEEILTGKNRYTNGNHRKMESVLRLSALLTDARRKNGFALH